MGSELIDYLHNSGPIIVLQFLSGLISAFNLTLIALGLNLIFGVSRLINLAHGSLFMVGAYVMSSMYKESAGLAQFFFAVLISASVTALVGLFIEVVLLRRIYKKGPALQLILTFSVSLVIVGIIRIIWGTQYVPVQRPLIFSDGIDVLGLSFPSYNIFILFTSATFVGLLFALIRYSRWGLYVRAASLDRMMLEALGVNVNKIMTQVFVLGSALAGIAGAVAAPTISVSLQLGTTTILNAFNVVIIGGLGNYIGALIGAFLVAELNSLSVVFLPNFSSLVVYVVVFFVLLFRPYGLMGINEGRTEDIGEGQ